MKEFIKKARISHLVILTCLIVMAGVIYIISLKQVSLAGTVIGSDGSSKANIILSIEGSHQSVVSDSLGRFYIRMPKKILDNGDIKFSLKERKMALLPPAFGYYEIPAAPKNIKVKIVNSGDEEAIKSLENRVMLYSYLFQKSPNQPLIVSETDGPKNSSRDTRNYIAKINQYYGTRLDINSDFFGEEFYNTNERSAKSKTKKELNILADHYYFEDDYNQAMEYYWQAIDKWKMNDLSQQENFTINYKFLNAKLMDFFFSEDENHTINDENEYLMQIGEQYNRLLNSTSAQRNISNKATIANNIAVLADLCYRYEPCKNEGSDGLERAINLLASIPLDILYQTDVNLWADTINAMLILGSRISMLPGQCNTKQLQNIIDLAIPGIENPPNSTYAIMVDLPINLINTLTILGDCDTRHAMDTYSKAIELLNEFKELKGFLDYANDNERLDIEKSLCVLYRKSSNVQGRDSAIKLIDKSISCLQGSISSVQNLDKNIDNLVLLADSQKSLAVAYIKKSFFLGFPEKLSSLNEAVKLLRRARKSYSRLNNTEHVGEQNIYIAETYNYEGAALLEMAESQTLTQEAKQDIVKEAKKLIMEAYNLDGNNFTYLDSLAWVDFKLGHTLKAKSKLEEVLARMEQTAKRNELVDIQAHLAEIYLYTGQKQESLKMVSKIKKNNPNAYQLYRINSLLSAVDQ